jgi:hypothetical protein
MTTVISNNVMPNACPFPHGRRPDLCLAGGVNFMVIALGSKGSLWIRARKSTAFSENQQLFDVFPSLKVGFACSRPILRAQRARAPQRPCVAGGSNSTPIMGNKSVAFLTRARCRFLLASADLPP